MVGVRHMVSGGQRVASTWWAAGPGRLWAEGTNSLYGQVFVTWVMLARASHAGGTVVGSELFFFYYCVCWGLSPTSCQLGS